MPFGSVVGCTVRYVAVSKVKLDERGFGLWLCLLARASCVVAHRPEHGTIDQPDSARNWARWASVFANPKALILR